MIWFWSFFFFFSVQFGFWLLVWGEFEVWILGNVQAGDMEMGLGSEEQ